MDDATSTNPNESDNVTFEKLMEAIQKLTPVIYYMTSIYAPKVDPDTGEECFLKVSALFDAEVDHVIVAHPDSFPKLREIAKNGRYRLIDYAERLPIPPRSLELVKPKFNWDPKGWEIIPWQF